MGFRNDRAPGSLAVDHPLNIATGGGHATIAGGGGQVASEVVQIHVQAVEELERPATRAVNGRGKRRS